MPDIDHHALDGTRRWLAALAVLLVLAGALLAPSVHGAFLLDDLPNLGGLERVAQGEQSVMGFASAGRAGPVGRPLSLLSFALQADAWPYRPAAFKQVNLALHLACGAALAWLLLTALRVAHPALAAPLSLAVAAAWLVHPLQLSTVAYVVQRMTILAALPMLLGLVAYCHGRIALAREPRAARGYLIAIGGLAIGGGIGMLAKESAALIVVLAAVLEHTLLAELAAPTAWRRVRALVLHLPLAAGLAALVAWSAGWGAGGFEGRDFSLVERALSQPRVLLAYLGVALWPDARPLGIFHDDFAVSRGLLDPWTTAPALAALVASVVVAAWARRAAPLLAFGLAWFLGNHLLESTVLPLELYFEHRNYLALVGPLVAAGGAVAWLATRWPAQGRATVVLAALLLGALAARGAVEAQRWADPLAQAERWAVEHPGSLRAQSYLANLRKVRGDVAGAAAVYVAEQARFADGASFAFDWLELGCGPGEPPLPDAALLRARAAAPRFSYGPSAALDRMVRRFEGGEPCARVPLALLAELTDALAANPAYARDAWLYPLLASRIARLRGDRAGAIAAIGRAFALRPEPEYALTEASWRLEGDDLDGAVAALARADAAIGSNPLRRAGLATRMAAVEAAIAARQRGPEAR
jgi:hypothetical protein